MTATTLTELPPLPAPSTTTDRNRPEARRAVLAMLAAGAAGALFGAGIAKVGFAGLPKASLAPLQKLVVVLAVLVTAALVPLVHELGHLLGGRLAGFGFEMLIWGPLKVWREAGRIRVGRNRSWSLAGGMALSVPRRAGTGNGHAALMVAGGPVSSLVLAAVLFALSRLPAFTAPNPSFLTVIGTAMLLAGAVTSLAIGIVTLVPMRTSGFLTDGARLLRLARGGGTAVRDRAMMSLVGLATSSTRPRDWPPALAADVDADRDGSPMDALGPMMAYYHHLDRGAAAEAHASLARAAERMGTVPPAARGSFAMEMAFYERVVRGDAVRAAEWLQMGTGSALEDPKLRSLLEAMVKGEREAVMAVLPEIEGRSAVDRMRGELVRRVVR